MTSLLRPKNNKGRISLRPPVSSDPSRSRQAAFHPPVLVPVVFLVFTVITAWITLRIP
jgi:hypothetical protein